MHVLVTNFDGNPNVGLYGLSTNKHILLGKDVSQTYDKEIAKVTQKPIERITIAGTSLIGVFCVWSNNKLLVPQLIFDHELKVLETLGLDVSVINTDLTCLGNNIVVGPKGAIINPEFTDEALTQISEALGVDCHRRKIMEIEAVGSIGIVRDERGLFHRNIPPEEVEELEELLGVQIQGGTINMGNPYIHSGIILLEEGFIVGEASGGPEIAHADEALGFITT